VSRKIRQANAMREVNEENEKMSSRSIGGRDFVVVRKMTFSFDHFDSTCQHAMARARRRKHFDAGVALLDLRLLI
jgi:hypothetical protein